MAFKMVMVYRYLKTNHDMKENGKKVKCQAMEGSHMVMETFTRANGTEMDLMDMDATTNMEVLSIRVNGTKTNNMV